MKTLYLVVTVLGGLLMLAGIYALSPAIAMIVGGLALYVVGYTRWNANYGTIVRSAEPASHEAAADRLIDEVQRERPFRPIAEP
jgi:hypothetical protein